MHPATDPRIPPITPPATIGLGPLLNLYNIPADAPPAIYLQK